MNSVLLQDPEQANQHTGRYGVGLNGVYQTLHDRLLEALQKWVPPDDKQSEPLVAASSPQSQASPVGHEASIEVPALFPSTSIPERTFVGSGGVQIDLSKLQLLLKSTQSTTFPSQYSPGLKILSDTRNSIYVPETETSCDQPLPSKNFMDNRPPQANFCTPLSICTSGLQCQTLDPLAARIFNITDRFNSQQNGLLVLPSLAKSDKTTTACQLTSAPTTSSNLLHQLLTGADISQVRNRSELIEPGLCSKLTAPDSKSAIHSQNSSTANDLQVDEVRSSTESITGDASPVNQYSTSFSAAIPFPTNPFVHSPMDTTTTFSTHLDSVSESSSLQQSLSGINCGVNQSVSNTASLVENLICLLVELQKSQFSGCLPTHVSPQTNSSPCPTSTEGQGMQSSLRSSILGPSNQHPTEGFITNGLTLTHTPTVSSTKCLRQLLTTHIPKSSTDSSSSAKWQHALKHNPQHSSPLYSQQPVPWLAANYSVDRIVSDNNDTYELRPRSNSDVHNTSRYRLHTSRDFRSRSHTKPERNVHRRAPRLVRDHCTESESESTCELESSLFAQLILSPESPESSSSRPSLTSESCRNARERLNPGDDGNHSPTPTTCAQSTSSRDSILSPNKSTAVNTPITIIKPNSSTADSLGSPSLSLTCHSKSRIQIFEWLRESDLFVAEHCFDIPLGALLAAAISPGRSHWIEVCCSALITPNQTVEQLPGLVKHVVNKLWHQLLLVSLVENNFEPQCVTIRPGYCQEQDEPLTTNRVQPDHCHSQLLRDKVLQAISSLAALDREESPAPDAHLVTELNRLIAEGTRLRLTPGLFRLIRYCILAQNAYPHHFSTAYSEVLSELETELTNTPDSPTLSDVLKLLNHLHCFDAGTLKQFFSLSVDAVNETGTSSVRPPPITPADTQYWSGGLGNFKRKAADGNDELLLHRDTVDGDTNAIQVRSRAYTTTGCNKSARLSTICPDIDCESTGTNSNVPFQGRPRSDTVPSTNQHHHPRRVDRSWRIGIR